MPNSQSFLPVEEIKDDLVFLKDGGVSLVLSTSAVNFGLLFETEQVGIIDAFAGLLNSLSFPIQIVIRSKRLDVSSYLIKLDQAISMQSNPLLSQITAKYRAFVESLIKENNVLDKQFYLVINVSAIELGILHKKAAERSHLAATILMPRRDHLVRQLQRIGLKARQMGTADLIKLIYDIYNAATESETIEDKIQVAPAPTPLRRISPVIVAPPPSAPQPVVVAQPQVAAPIKPAIPSIQISAQPRLSSPLPPRPVLSRYQPYITPLSPPFVVEELVDEFGP